MLGAAIHRLKEIALRRQPGCGQEPASAPPLAGVEVEHVAVPGTPFAVAAAGDGQRVFVSLPGRQGSALAVLDADPWRLSAVHQMAAGEMPRGLALSADDRRLLVASAGRILVVDAEALGGSGPLPVVAVCESSAGALAQVALAGVGDRYAVATGEDNASVAVFDFGDTLGRERPDASRAMEVPVPPGPTGVSTTATGLAFVTCQSNHRGGQPGVLCALDVAAALRDPRRAVLATVPAGCGPVRVRVASRPGEPAYGPILWVTARAGNCLLAFDGSAVLDGARRPAAVVPVGAAPVGMAALHSGSLIVVCNSNRYGGEQPQSLAVVDAAAALAGEPGLRATIPAGVFPREAITLADDATAVSTNFRSRTVQVSRVPAA